MDREWQRIGGLVAAALICFLPEWVANWRDGDVARAFMPGEIGREPGREPPGPSPRAYLTRAMYHVADEGEKEWSRENELTQGLSFSHNLRNVFPPKLFDEHPEFFPLEDGVRFRPPEGTYFWQPDVGREDVARYAAETARRFFDENPGAESFSLGVNDGLLFGESPELMKLVGPGMDPSPDPGHLGRERLKWFRDRPNYSPLVFTFMNRAADELAKSHPDKLLGCLAYYWCENAPPFPVRRQIVPFLTADRSQGYDPSFWREEALLQRRWVAAKGTAPKAESEKRKAGEAGRLGLYDYLYGSGFLVPRIHTRLLAENLRRARRAGFTDYYAESHSNWGLDGPMLWLAAQLLQDPEQSPEALLDEYYRRFFREAAVPMRRFFERCERQWMTQSGAAYWLKHYRNESQADLFPSAVCRELRELLVEAARAAARDPMAERRVEFVSDAFGAAERLVAMQEARVALYRCVLRDERSWRDIAKLLGGFAAARNEFENYTKALREPEPLAVASVQWRDYLQDDPVPGALLAIGRTAAVANELATAKSVVAHDDEARSILDAATEGGAELLRERSFEGILESAKRAAGLNYGMALPRSWLSLVEPSEHFEAVRVDGNPPLLRLRGNKNSQVYRWNAASPGRLFVARVAIRGKVSPSGVANLMLGWLGADNQHLGLQVARLPEGDWPQWVELELAAKPPEGASWAGVGLRVQNQAAGDWIEVRQFSLRAMP